MNCTSISHVTKQQAYCCIFIIVIVSSVSLFCIFRWFLEWTSRFLLKMNLWGRIKLCQGIRYTLCSYQEKHSFDIYFYRIRLDIFRSRTRTPKRTWKWRAVPMYGHATPFLRHFHVVFDVRVLDINLSIISLWRKVSHILRKFLYIYSVNLSFLIADTLCLYFWKS
jgi:hypothetical protein